MRPSLSANDAKDRVCGDTKPLADGALTHVLECEHANLSDRCGIQLGVVVRHASHTLYNTSEYVKGVLNVLRMRYLFKITQAVVSLVAILVVRSVAFGAGSYECFAYEAVDTTPYTSELVVIGVDGQVPTGVPVRFEYLPFFDVTSWYSTAHLPEIRDFIPGVVRDHFPAFHVVTSENNLPCVLPLVKRLYMALNCEHRRPGA